MTQSMGSTKVFPSKPLAHAGTLIRYLKCLVKVTKPPFTLVIAVSLDLAYSLSSLVRLFLSLYFFYTYKVEVMREVGVSVRVLKKPGDGENMYSVLEGFFPVPM